MISNQKELYAFIDKILKPLGYVRKKYTWYLYTSECICFLVIAKSPWGGQFEEGMGCFLREINTEKDGFPAYNKNHLMYGISDIVGREKVHEAFDLENLVFSNNEREEIIKELIEKYALVFLRDVSTREGIKEAMGKYNGLEYTMKGKLRDALEI